MSETVRPIFRREVEQPQMWTAHGSDMKTKKRVLLKSGEVPHLMQFATSVSWDGCNTAIDPHVHGTMYEIYFIRGGHATFTIGGETFIGGPGDLIVVPPKMSHSYVVADGEVLDLAYFGIATGDKPKG